MTLKKRTTQLLAELKTLAREAADNLYRRIELAAQVMRDLDWIAQTHGGSDLKAMDALQDEYFRDLGGFISLGKLILMYDNIAESQWQDCRYDVAAVEVEFDNLTREETETKEQGKKTAWKPIALERADEIDRLKKQIDQLVQANSELRDENTELRSDVARLEGRIEEMDRRSTGRLVSV